MYNHRQFNFDTPVFGINGQDGIVRPDVDGNSEHLYVGRGPFVIEQGIGVKSIKNDGDSNSDNPSYIS